MTKLTTKARKKLPAAAFAGPGRSYPVNDRAHAANAKARATQMVDAGKLSPAVADRAQHKRSTRIERAVNSAKTRLKGVI